MVDKILNSLVKIFQFLEGIIILIMTVSNILQIVTRYFVSYQVMWVEDISIMGLYWIFAFGMPMAWVVGAHLDMNAFEKLIPVGMKRVLWYVQQACGIAGGIGLGVVAWECIQVNKGFVMSIVGFDEMWRYVPLLVGGILLAIVSSLLVVRAVVDKRNGKELEV